MSPALTDAPSEGVCFSCMVTLDERGLKCTKCHRFIHVQCSELPDYILVRYAVSSIQYCCIQCCKSEIGEENNREETDAIQQLREREKSIVREITDENSQVSTETETHTNGPGRGSTEDGTPPNGTPNQSEGTSSANANSQQNGQTNQKSDSVCRYYLQKKCREGLKGTNCKYQHPKICFKWQKNGSDRGGCKKDNCSFFHPRICHNSLKHRNCQKHGCRLFHLKGTVTYENAQNGSKELDDYPQVPSNSFRESKGQQSALMNGRKDPGNAKGSWNRELLKTHQTRPIEKDIVEPYMSPEREALRRDFLEFRAELKTLLEGLKGTMEKPPVTVLQRGQRLDCRCSHPQ